MNGHQLEHAPAGEKREGERSEKTFPGFLRADVRNELMTPNQAAGQIRAHIAELRDGDQIEDIKLARHSAGRGARHHVNDLGNKVVKPKDVEQSKDRVR